MVTLLTKILSSKSNQEWSRIFEGAAFPYGAVNDFQNVFQDPQVVHNKTVRNINHESLGTVKQVRPAVTYSGSKNEIRSAPPVLGFHTNAIMIDILGMEEEDVEKMMRDKVIR